MSKHQFPLLGSKEDPKLILSWFNFWILHVEPLIPPSRPLHFTGHHSAVISRRLRLSTMHLMPR